MPTIVHTLLHETPPGATVSYAYRDRAFALYAARNAAEAHAAELRAAESAFLHGPVAPDTYDVVIEDHRSWAVLSVRHRPTGEPGSSYRWIVQEQEVVEACYDERCPAVPSPPCNAAA